MHRLPTKTVLLSFEGIKVVHVQWQWLRSLQCTHVFCNTCVQENYACIWETWRCLRNIKSLSWCNCWYVVSIPYLIFFAAEVIFPADSSGFSPKRVWRSCVVWRWTWSRGAKLLYQDWVCNFCEGDEGYRMMVMMYGYQEISTWTLATLAECVSARYLDQLPDLPNALSLVASGHAFLCLHSRHEVRKVRAAVSDRESVLQMWRTQTQVTKV